MQKLHTGSENTYLNSFLTMDGQELKQIWRNYTCSSTIFCYTWMLKLLFSSERRWQNGLPNCMSMFTANGKKNSISSSMVIYKGKKKSYLKNSLKTEWAKHGHNSCPDWILIKCTLSDRLWLRVGQAQEYLGCDVKRRNQNQETLIHTKDRELYTLITSN